MSMGRERLALELRRSRRSLLVIALGLAASVSAGLAVASQLGLQAPWTHGQRFEVTVGSAYGVTPGKSLVKVAGVPAGRITGVRRAAGGGAVLEVDVDRERGPVRADAEVRLRPRTQLQDMYLDVVDRGRGPVLGEDDTLPVSRSRTSVPVSEVLDTFQPVTRRRLRTLISELGVGLDDGGADLRRAFVEVVPFLRAGAALADEARARDRQIRRVVQNSRVLLEELARRDGAVTSLVTDAGATFGAIGDERRALDDTLVQLPPTVERLRVASGRLDSALARTEPALRALRSPVRRLPAALAAVDRLGVRARPTLSRVDVALRDLAPAVRRLRPTATILRRTAAVLAPQLPRLGEIVQVALVCRRPLNKFFQHTLSFYKYGSPYGPVGRSEFVYGSASALGSASPSETPGPDCYDRKAP